MITAAATAEPATMPSGKSIRTPCRKIGDVCNDCRFMGGYLSRISPARPRGSFLCLGFDLVMDHQGELHRWHRRLRRRAVLALVSLRLLDAVVRQHDVRKSGMALQSVHERRQILEGPGGAVQRDRQI